MLGRFCPPRKFQTAGELQPASFQVAELFAQHGIPLPLSLPRAMIGMLVTVECLVAEGFVANGVGAQCRVTNPGVTKPRIISCCVTEFWKHCLTSARNPGKLL